MTSKKQPLLAQYRQYHLLYDGRLLQAPPADFLSGKIFQLCKANQKVSSGGRGQAWFIELDDLCVVLRKYLRGGLMAKINQQTYFSLRAENSRSFKEWYLLRHMLDLGLPVPRPIAAAICRWPLSISPFYQAHILLERLAHSLTLDQLLAKQVIADNTWHAIGQCLARFHKAQVYHADLNANNIMLNDQFEVFLIDFDKGEIRNDCESSAAWKLDNLNRLQRSLLKQRGIHKSYSYEEGNWQALLQGYNLRIKEK